MKRLLIHRLIPLLLALAALAPWGVVHFLPQEAFAQVGTITGTTQVPNRGAITNAPRREDGSVSWSSAAASGAVSVGACLGAAGISLGAGIAAAAAALGLGGAAKVINPTTAPAAAALMVPVIDPGAIALLGQIAKTQSATLLQVGSLQAKESMLDCIAWALAKMIWRAVAASIIDWINTGFNGRPAFIQNYQRFFLGIVDRTIGEIIESDKYLAFLCSPFQLNIRIALAMRYAQRAPTCTLTEIIGNVENFARSFQLGGGWPSWLQFTVVPVNNPYGGYLTSEAVISFTYQTRLSTEKFERTQNLSSFLSQKKTVCTDPAKKETCREITVTPGELIAQQAGEVIGGGNTQLLLADELNEIVDALVAQLLSKALGSLFSLSQPTAYQDDYYRGTTFTGDLGGGGGTGDTIVIDENAPLIEQIDQAIAREREFQALNTQAIALVESSQLSLRQVAACWHSKEAGTSTPPVADPGDRNQAGVEGRTVDFTVTSLERKKDPFRGAIEQSARNIATLDQLIVRAASASSAAELDIVVRDFNGLLSTGDFARPADSVRVETQMVTLENELSSYQTLAQTEMTRCQYFPQPAPSPFEQYFPPAPTIPQ